MFIYKIVCTLLLVVILIIYVLFLNSKLIQWLLSLIIGEAAGENAGNTDNIWKLCIHKTNNNDAISDSDVYSLYKLTQEEMSEEMLSDMLNRFINYTGVGVVGKQDSGAWQQ